MLIENAVSSETLRLIDGEWWKYPGGRRQGRRRCITGTCKRCGGEFVTTPIHPSTTRTGEFCSRECKWGWQQDHAKPDETGICPQCSRRWSRRPRGDGTSQRFCSWDCLQEWRHRKRVGECERCGGSFVQTTYPDQRYCSHECYAEANRGSSHWNFSNFSLDAYREARSKAAGPWSRNRRRALERDGRHCRLCAGGHDGATLDVHHVVPVLEGGTNELPNLLTVCRACHRSIESGGQYNATAIYDNPDAAQRRIYFPR